MSYVSEQPARTSDGQFSYAPGTEERADAVLAKILGTPAPSAAPVENTEVADAAPVAEAESPGFVPDEVLTYAKIDASIQEKLSPEARAAMSAALKEYSRIAKAQAERLNQLEKATQAPASETPAPAPQRTSEDYTKAAEPLVALLGLGQEDLPTVAQFAKTIAETVRNEVTGQLGPVVELQREAQQELANSTMKVIGERFPGFNDAANKAAVAANVEAIRHSPKYQTCAPTAKERAIQLWHDAAVITGLQAAPPAVSTQQRDSARNAGQVSPAQKVVAPVGETPQQRIDRLALKWASSPG